VLAALPVFEMLCWLSFCLVFVMLSGFFSGTETGLYCVNNTRLRLAAHRGDPSAVRLQTLLADRAGLLFTTLVGTNIANYLAPVCLTMVFLGSIDAATDTQRAHPAELYTTLALTPIVFIFGEIVPKNIFQRNADRLMSRASSLLHVAHAILRTLGIIGTQRWLSDFVSQRLTSRPASGSLLHSRAEVYHMLRESAAEGALSLTQSSILERLHTLGDIRVGKVMVPVRSVVMLPADATPQQVERNIRRTPYSRMPVYVDSRRRIRGVVHLLDVLTAEPSKTMAELAKPPVELSPGQPVIDALTTLQRECRRMAGDLRGVCFLRAQRQSTVARLCLAATQRGALTRRLALPVGSRLNRDMCRGADATAAATPRQSRSRRSPAWTAARRHGSRRTETCHPADHPGEP